MQDHPVKSICRERGVSLKWVAKQLGISTSMMSRVMNGHCEPQLMFYVAAAAVLNVDIKDVIRREGMTDA